MTVEDRIAMWKSRADEVLAGLPADWAAASREAVHSLITFPRPSATFDVLMDSLLRVLPEFAAAGQRLDARDDRGLLGLAYYMDSDMDDMPYRLFRLYPFWRRGFLCETLGVPLLERNTYLLSEADLDDPEVLDALDVIAAVPAPDRLDAEAAAASCLYGLRQITDPERLFRAAAGVRRFGRLWPWYATARDIPDEHREVFAESLTVLIGQGLPEEPAARIAKAALPTPLTDQGIAETRALAQDTELPTELLVGLLLGDRADRLSETDQAVIANLLSLREDAAS